MKTKTLRMSLRQDPYKLCVKSVVIFILANFELELMCVMAMEFIEIAAEHSMRGNGGTIRGVDKEDISQAHVYIRVNGKKTR